MSLHSPLPSSEASFRLLRVLPSRSNNSQIRCELTIAPILSLSGKYIAGSYVWGPEVAVATIRVNGIEVQVRENLMGFLHVCRRKWHSFVIWIDALCINQDDYEERSKQVATMGQIYANAAAAYYWLGTTPGVVHALDKCEAAAPRRAGVQIP